MEESRYESMGIRNVEQREDDYRDIARLYCQGYSYPRMADLMTEMRGKRYTPSTIAGDVKLIQRRWLESTLVDFNQAKADALARIEALEAEYWEAWRRSLKPLIDNEVQDDEGKKVSRDGEKVPYKNRKTTTSTKMTWGNPEYLQGVERCIEKRIKIFGIYAPDKININWKHELIKMGISDEEFDQEADLLAAQFEAMALEKINEWSEAAGRDTEELIYEEISETATERAPERAERDHPDGSEEGSGEGSL